MNKPTERQMKAMVGILKKLGLTWDEVEGIITFIDSKEMLIEMVDRLEAKSFKLTPRQTKDICYQVMVEYLT